jgi:predicted unusual protein kinase regulating ubiquinone biosynthesis (AarF/ABC1/UbiB family)
MKSPCPRLNQTVAVKVQYPRLAGLIAWDVQTIHNLATLVALLFEVRFVKHAEECRRGPWRCETPTPEQQDYNFKFLVPEFEASIKLELDFLQEATNAERTAKLFYRNRKVHIPRVRWDLSSRRVLTMEFIEGCKGE